MYKDFEVILSSLSSAVSEKGFGTILILDHEKARDYTLITVDDISTLGKTSKVNKLATRLFQQRPAPQEVAVVGVADGTAETIVAKLDEVANKDWFWLVCTDNAPATIQAIAEKIATLDKFYGATFNEVENQGENGDFVASFIEDLEFSNTFLMYDSTPDTFLAEALVVNMSYNVGGKTAKFQELTGVTAVDIKDGNIKYLHANGAFTYAEQMGVAQTTEGIATDTKFIDETLGNMWIKARLEERLMQVALDADKIPYTNQGIGMLLGAVHEVLSIAAERGIIAEEDGEPLYIVEYKRREEVPTADVRNRRYDYIQIQYTLSGAIHSGKIYAEPTYAVIRL